MHIIYVILGNSLINIFLTLCVVSVLSEHVSGSPRQSSPFTGGRSMVTKTLTNRHSPKHDGNGAVGLIKDGGGGDSGGTSIAKMQIPRSKTGTDSQSVETGHSEESDSQNQSGFNVSPKHKGKMEIYILNVNHLLNEVLVHLLETKLIL